MTDSLLEGRIANGLETLQICHTTNTDAVAFGVFVADDFENGIEKLQETVKLWAQGICLEHSHTGMRVETANITALAARLDPIISNQTLTSLFNVSGLPPALDKQATCTAIQVSPGDSCASLSSRCGIREADFTKYNAKDNLCANLVVKQWVCCSAGELPDVKPQPQSDGTCATYKVVVNDGCFAIADGFGLKVEDIDKYNIRTWGWAGCARLQPDQVICLSSGNTPMPAQVEGVVCGPQMVGTQKPSGNYDGFDLAKLNPCPLKACCSGWGYCGTISEFCTQSKSETGAPGTFKKGENGCISNCGMDIVNNKVAPASFAKVGYFQAYNSARNCLNMDVTEIPSAEMDLTHVHFAFLGISADLNVVIPENVKAQFEKFVATKFPFKKIISFGGWAESTESATYQRYKDAVNGANRNTWASNVLNFMSKYDIQGVDFDWEYPAAPDIPGVPSGGLIEATNYLRFLTIMKGLLNTSGRSLSIALPASFWYLRAFPVEDLAKTVDYFIYMTYDLHGQWDYGSKFSNPGCDTGNCLRSHVNLTETENALAMITKAGVPASKIFVGVSSYGRSFRMADKSCTDPSCRFTGSSTHSDAEPGACTGTGGYISNAELDEIFHQAEIGTDGVQAKRWWDSVIDTDIMTYGTQGNGMTDWVAYMSETTKARRIDWIKTHNFGGTSDWAVDLTGWFQGNKDPNFEGKGWTYGDPPNLAACDASSWNTTIEGVEAEIDSIPPHCRGLAITSALVLALGVSIEEYGQVKEGYDDKFGYYVDWMKDSIDKRIEDYLALGKGPGLKHMDCKWSNPTDSGQGPCTDAGRKWKDTDYGTRVVEFAMRNETGFYDDLMATAGIKKDWLWWDTNYYTEQPCLCMPNTICECDRNQLRRRNFPRRLKNRAHIQIDNPKAIVDAAIPNMDALFDRASAAYLEMLAGVANASTEDVVLGLSTPVFMLQDASKSIKEIKDIGAEQKEAKTRDLVFMILSIVFSVIPFAGQAASLLGGATAIARAALLIGEAGNMGLVLVEVVENPESAPWVMLQALIGAAGGGIGSAGSRTAFKNAADVRRKLDDPKAGGVKSFSKEFQRKDGLVQNIIKKCSS